MSPEEKLKAAIEVGKLLVPPVLKRVFKENDPSRQSASGADLEEALADYLERAVETHSFTKTLVLRDLPLPVRELYEPLDVTVVVANGSSSIEEVLRATGVRALLGLRHPLLLTATAGAGKSTLMRHLFLDSLESEQMVPFLIELRRLEPLKDTVLSYLAALIGTPEEEVHIRDVAELLNKGGFVLLLDGFDEVNESSRSNLLNEIVSLIDRFPNNLWILSSRPDSRLEAVVKFRVVRPAPLRLDQCISLIQRIPYEPQAKSKFSDYLRSQPDSQFHSFTENPLLLSIMFMTYTSEGNIQFSRQAFYSDAFHAMYSWHDSSKYGYQREFAASLDRAALESVAEGFAIQTFVSEKRAMSESTALSLLQNSIRSNQLDARPEDVLTDLTQKVCVLMRDGRYITYSHRSFEEYFAAKFINRQESVAKTNLMRQVGKRSVRDNVCVQILHELNAVPIERAILLPAVRRVVPSAASWETMFAFILKSVRRELLTGNGWSGDSHKKLGSYRAYLGYLIQELSVLFPGLPRTRLGDESSGVINIDRFNERIGNKNSDQVSMDILVRDLRAADGEMKRTAEHIAGITMAQTRWLFDVQAKMKSRSTKQEQFLSDLLKAGS